MSNLRLIAVNAADTAILTASPSAVSTLPVTYLQVPERAFIWRSTSTASQTILGNFAGAESVSGVALAHHNLSAVGTWRVRFWASAGQTGTLLYDSGTVTMLPANASIWFDLVQDALSFSIVLTDASPAKSYLQAQRLFIGRAFEPLVNMDYGLALTPRSDARQRRSDGGSLRTDYRKAYRHWALRLALLNDTERAQLQEDFRVIGLERDLFLSCYPGVGSHRERHYSGHVKLTEMPVPVNDRHANFAVELAFAEA